jgi:hypothetical protein
MTRFALVLAAAALLTGCDQAAAPTAPTAGGLAPPTLQATSGTEKTPIDLTFIAFVDCAGEELEFHLREQLVSHISVDAGGHLHTHFTINDKGSTGVGLVSGAVWHQTGATKENLNVSESDTGNDTFVNSLNLIGGGRAPNLLIHEVFHITVNANGVLVVVFDKPRVECK